MDYEKKYNEAVKELGNFLALLKRNGVANDDGIIETNLVRIFPELAESEDERIRKEIRDFLIDMECKKEWIAYLEKQKEQKPAEWSEEDEEMLDAMIDIVSNSLYEPLCPREGMLAWLKSLQLKKL